MEQLQAEGIRKYAEELDRNPCTNKYERSENGVR